MQRDEDRTAGTQAPGPVLLCILSPSFPHGRVGPRIGSPASWRPLEGVGSEAMGKMPAWRHNVWLMGFRKQPGVPSTSEGSICRRWRRVPQRRPGPRQEAFPGWRLAVCSHLHECHRAWLSSASRTQVALSLLCPQGAEALRRDSFAGGRCGAEQGLEPTALGFPFRASPHPAPISTSEARFRPPPPYSFGKSLGFALKDRASIKDFLCIWQPRGPWTGLGPGLCRTFMD
nr:uncharacterized protein LOC111753167 [Loxodonta africana]